MTRVIQNEVLYYCVIPAKAGIQGRGTCIKVWMPAFAGMTLRFLIIPQFKRLTPLDVGESRATRRKIFGEGFFRFGAPRKPLKSPKTAKEMFGKIWRKKGWIWKSWAEKLGDWRLVDPLSFGRGGAGRVLSDTNETYKRVRHSIPSRGPASLACACARNSLREYPL